MTSDPPHLSFRDLLHPMTPDAFFDAHFASKPAHLPGPEAKLSGVFSWDEANRLLNISKIWSSATLRLLQAGREVSPGEYCYEGRNRDGKRVLRPDPPVVLEALRAGMTLALGGLETMTPSLSAVAAALQMALGGVARCTACCAWDPLREELPPRFDLGEGFLLQIEGAGGWVIHEGRFEHPAALPGYEYASLPEDYHRQAAGAPSGEVALTQGDVLYIPSGQYYRPVSTDPQSLFLHFAVTRPAGNDFLELLLETLVEETAFREPVPHFDERDALREHFGRLAARMRKDVAAGDVGVKLRALQQGRATRYGFPRYALPDTDGVARYRVRAAGARLVRRGSDWQLQLPAAKETLRPDEVELGDWILVRDSFSAGELARAFPAVAPDALAAATARFVAIGLLDRL